MKNGLSFDIEDWFQVENLRSAVPRNQWEKKEFRVEANTNSILEILEENDIKATFFVLGWVAEKCPGLIKEIGGVGHEIASHGFSHELVYNMSREEFRDDIKRSKEFLESIAGQEVIGYRAPSFSITKESLWALDILKEEGIKYDSSIFPVSYHDRYGFPEAGVDPFVWPNGLLEIPLAVIRVSKLSLPVAGGGYFRLFPYCYFRYLLRRINKQGRKFTFYLHPWELDPGQPRMKVPLKYSFRHYVNLDKTERRLRRLIKEFSFDRISAAYCVDEPEKYAN